MNNIKSLELILEDLYQNESHNSYKIKLYEMQLAKEIKDHRNILENGKPNG